MEFVQAVKVHRNYYSSSPDVLQIKIHHIHQVIIIQDLKGPICIAVMVELHSNAVGLYMICQGGGGWSRLLCGWSLKTTPPLTSHHLEDSIYLPLTCNCISPPHFEITSPHVSLSLSL